MRRKDAVKILRIAKRLVLFVRRRSPFQRKDFLVMRLLQGKPSISDMKTKELFVVQNTNVPN